MSWRPRPLDVVAAALLLIVFAPALAIVLSHSQGPAGEHGPVVVLVAAWLLWRERHDLRIAPTPRWTRVGGLALILSLWVLLAARLDAFPTLEFPAALAVLASYLLARGGPPLLRTAWFPLVFLLFAVPAPGPLLWSALVHLKLLAAHLACAVLDPFVAVVRVGSTIHLTGAVLDVDDACAGLRGATGIVAFAALHGYLGGDRRRALVGLALALPIALLANVARIVVLCSLALHGSSAAVGGPFHDATGFAVYVVAMLAIIGISRLVPAREVQEPLQEQPERAPALRPLTQAALLLPLLAVALATLAHAATSVDDVAEPIPVPRAVGPWSITPLPLTPRVEELLGGAASAMRCVGADGVVDVLVARTRGPGIMKTFHPPDECFIGLDFEVAEAGVRVLAAGLKLNRRVFRRGQEVVLVYFWNRVNGHDTVDPTGFRFETFSMRLRSLSPSDAMLLRLSTDVADGGLEQADGRLSAFAVEALPLLVPAR